MAESKSVVSPAEAVELCRQVGTEPPQWLLEKAGLAPRTAMDAAKEPDEDEDEDESEYGWRRYHKGWGGRR